MGRIGKKDGQGSSDIRAFFTNGVSRGFTNTASKAVNLSQGVDTPGKQRTRGMYASIQSSFQLEEMAKGLFM